MSGKSTVWMSKQGANPLFFEVSEVDDALRGQVDDDHDMEHQEYVDQFELELPGLVPGDLHPRDRTEWSEKRTEEECRLLGPPFVLLCLAFVPDVHHERESIQDDVDQED